MMDEERRDLRARIEVFGAGRRIEPPLLDRWLALAAPDAEALLDIAQRLRLGANHLRDFFDWAEEIAVRRGAAIAAVLGDASVAAALARGRGRNDAVTAVRQALRRLRFPQLAAAEDRLARRVAALGLPPEVRVVLPANLEAAELRLEVRALGAEHLRAVVDRLRDLARGPELEEIFELLAEAQ